jgi:uncharacterized protein YndB with AHSA1/START domain
VIAAPACRFLPYTFDHLQEGAGGRRHLNRSEPMSRTPEQITGARRSGAGRVLGVAVTALAAGCGTGDDAAPAAASVVPVDAHRHDLEEVRVFDAPPAAVWRAWAEAEAVQQWWGPHGFTVPVARMEFREGGTSFVCMQAPAEFGGGLYCNTWTYTRLVPHERIEFVLRFADEAGNVIDPAEQPGMPAGIPREVPHVIELRELDGGRTEFRITESGYTTQEAVDTSRAGLHQVLEKLESFLRPG